MKKIVLVLLIFAVVGTAAFAFDIETFADPIEPGNILISPTFNLGTYSYSGMVIGVTASGDYALPIPIMVGLEVGVALTTWEYGPTSIPILARASWHPNFEVDGLDVYLRLKLGYNIAFGEWSDYWKWGGGFSWGGSTGVRYFFSENMGVFGEVGYDLYGISIQGRYGAGYYGGVAGAIGTWFHAGVSFKIET